MNINVYQTPESEVEQKERADLEFYVVAPKKFLLLFFFTLGIYRLYWFYKNWSFHKKVTGKRLWPVMRAIFSIFFTHSLFALFDQKSKEFVPDYKWSASGVATIYVLFTVIESICDRLSWRSMGEPITDIIGVLVLPVIGWSLYKAQISANTACGDPAGERNSQLSLANYCWIGLGTLFWILFAIGLFDMTFGLVEEA